MSDINRLASVIKQIPGKGSCNGGKRVNNTDKSNISINIQNLLNGKGVKKEVNSKTEKESADTKVENYTYKTKSGTSMEGKLHYKKDGTIKFVSSNKYNPYTATFKSKEDLDANRPTTVTKLGKNNIGQEEISYKYNKKGIVTDISVKSSVYGKPYHIEKRDDNGRPLNIKEYTMDGKTLTKEIKYQDVDANHRTSTVYDKDKKVVATTEETYENGKIAAKSVYDKDHNKTSDINYEKGRKVGSTSYYKDGKVSSQTEYFPETGGIKSRTLYDETGNIKQQDKVENEPDGKFGRSAQVGQGDCYLLASINSLRATEEGNAMLENLIKTSTDANGKKTYTITLPGAKVAANSLAKDKNVDPNKMYIKGEYTFTEDEVKALMKQSGTKYSLGDADVVLLEAAFEQYRNECIKTMADNKIQSTNGLAGLVSPQDKSNPLAGGLEHDATFVLTGKPSNVYYPKNKPTTGLDEAALKKGKAVISGNGKGEMVSAAPSSINGEIRSTKSDLSRMLDDIANKQQSGNDTIVATASFNIMKNGKNVGGHALQLKEVTADKVVLINPWNPDDPNAHGDQSQEIVMSREDFEANCTSITYTELDKNYKIQEKDTKKLGEKTQKTTNNSGKTTPKTPGSKTPGSKNSDGEKDQTIRKISEALNKLKKQKTI